MVRSVATDGGFSSEREGKRRRIEEEDEVVAPIDKDTALEWAFALKRVTKGKTVIDSEVNGFHRGSSLDYSMHPWTDMEGFAQYHEGHR